MVTVVLPAIEPNGMLGPAAFPYTMNHQEWDDLVAKQESYAVQMADEAFTFAVEELHVSVWDHVCVYVFVPPPPRPLFPSLSLHRVLASCMSVCIRACVYVYVCAQVSVMRVCTCVCTCACVRAYQ